MNSSDICRKETLKLLDKRNKELRKHNETDHNTLHHTVSRGADFLGAFQKVCTLQTGVPKIA